MSRLKPLLLGAVLFVLHAAPSYSAAPDALAEKATVQSLSEWREWLVPLVAALIGGGMTLLGARWASAAEVDNVTHQKRHETYPALVSATSGLATYFPKTRWDGSFALDQADCKVIGRALSDWYYEKGGLLLSAESRDALFKLERALTRAASAKRLATPKFPDDAIAISKARLDDYRRQLSIDTLSDLQIESWVFGPIHEEAGATPAGRFRDFVFLQKLSSEFRTQLAKDIRGRRTPSN